MPLQSKETTDSGFYIPENCREPLNKGIIKAVGSEVTKVKKDDVAYRVKLWGTEIIEDGVTYFLMNEDSLLMID